MGNSDEPPPAVTEPAVVDEPPQAVVEQLTADEPLAELGPKTPELSVNQPQMELRENSVSRRRIKCMFDEEYSKHNESVGSESDVYIPSDAEHRVCGIPHCSEDIYI